MTVTLAKKAKGRADRLFSEIVRARGICEACELGWLVDRTSGLQCAHIIPRRFSWVRTDLVNAWSLCGGHHYLVDNYADRKMELVSLTIGLPTYDALVVKSQCRQKFDWVEEAARLKEIWDFAVGTKQ